MPERLSELEPRQRWRVLIRGGLVIVFTWAILLTVYYISPVGGKSSEGVVLRLVIGLVVVVFVLLTQTRQIVKAQYPELRAAQALAVVIPLFLVLFSALYLTLSHASPSAFSQNLDHTRALYFTVTVFSTVGFGDITPATDTVRIIVSIQMILDLVIIGAVVRLLLNAVKSTFNSTSKG
jgi:voltage-gated potassium channel